MDKQEIYNYIEQKAKIYCNRTNLPMDEPSYKFEPGNTPIPEKIDLTYNPINDKGLMNFDIDNHNFVRHVQLELNGITPRIYRTFDPNGSLMEIDNFKTNYIQFAEALDKSIGLFRLFVPSLTKSKFENEDKNEYTLKTDNGQLWIPGYVCKGASYEIMLASFDLVGFYNYKELRDYSDAMVKIYRSLRNKHFNAHFNNKGQHIDLEIKSKAVSEEKIRNDLEKVIEICNKY